MVKVFTLIKKKDGLTREEFSKYWEYEHGPLVAKMLPGVSRYIQNHAIQIGGGEPQYDGVVEMWFDDIDTWKTARDFYTGEAGKSIREDEERFLDRSKMVFIIAEGIVIKS